MVGEGFLEKMTDKNTQRPHINPDNPLEVEADWSEKDAAFFDTDALGKTEYHGKGLKYWEDVVKLEGSEVFFAARARLMIIVLYLVGSCMSIISVI